MRHEVSTLWTSRDGMEGTMRTDKDQNPIADALLNTLTSPNEMDSNWEQANVVDALGKISRGCHAIARAILLHALASNRDTIDGNIERHIHKLLDLK
jgi:hypothetical protein